MAEKSSLGRRVRELRRALGLSQEGLGLRLDVDRSYISRIENGYTKMPSMGILGNLAHALGVRTDDLLSAAGHATTVEPPARTARDIARELEVALAKEAARISALEGDLLLDYLDNMTAEERASVLRFAESVSRQGGGKGESSGEEGP